MTAKIALFEDTYIKREALSNGHWILETLDFKGALHNIVLTLPQISAAPFHASIPPGPWAAEASPLNAEHYPTDGTVCSAPGADS